MNYLKIYCDLMNKRLETPAFTTEKTMGQKHHIIPVSCQKRHKVLQLLNNYEVGQLVNLNFMEHYIAHCLLVRIFENVDTYSYQCMLAAFEGMNNRDDQNTKKHIGNKKYDMFRKRYFRDFWTKEKRNEWSKKYSGNNNPAARLEVRNKISEGLKEHEIKDTVRNKISESLKNGRRNEKNEIPVILYDLNYNLIKRFNSQKECAMYINKKENRRIISGEIGRYCKNNKPILRKYIVQYEDENFDNRVIAFNVLTNEMKIYDCCDELIKDIKISNNTMHDCLNFNYNCGGPFKNYLQKKHLILLKNKYKDDLLTNDKIKTIIDWAEEQKMLIKEKHSGKNNGNFGRHWTDEQKRKMSEIKRKQIKSGDKLND